MTPNAVLGQLDGLRTLARALVQGDADADDLIQDTAVAVLEHGGAVTDDRPLRPWLATVLRNRWRMARRSANRRLAREQVAALTEASDPLADSIHRARTLEKLAAALVALDEPFRTVVIRRYLDGTTAAALARELGVPAGTVRWRLKTALARLRAMLDETSPRWHGALIPLLGATVKAKISIPVIVVVILLLGAASSLWFVLDSRKPASDELPARRTATIAPHVAGPRSAAITASPVRPPLPGQNRAIVEPSDAEGGVISGRVINWSRGDGVTGAELTFTSDAGAATVRSGDDGAFELTPHAPGRFTLSAIAAPGYLPYAPELTHSTVRFVLAKGEAVRGITVFLFPALDYQGIVVDARGPVAGARVRLLEAPAGEQAIDRLETEWTTDHDGHFTFHAADDAVLEANRGGARGWGRLTGDVSITHQLTIKIGDAAARSATITGRAVDETGAPIGEVLVRAAPLYKPTPSAPVSTRLNTTVVDGDTRSGATATTGPDGSFTLTGLDRQLYDITGEIEDRAPGRLDEILGGTQGVTLILDAGQAITGQVIDGDGKPAPAYTLLVERREGTGRTLVTSRSIVEPHGRFSVRVRKGDYDLIASASGWAPSAPTAATAGAVDVTLSLSAGATLRGTVVAGEDGHPLAFARVMRETRGGGASAQPANAGTVTRSDGTFELTGIPPGPVSVTVAAGERNPRIEAGMTASDGQTIGPVTISLSKVLPGEQPTLELVGIGVALGPDGDALRVSNVLAGSGAEAAGIITGDRIIAIDGLSVVPLGLEGSIAKIRGIEGTTVAVTVQRNDHPLELIVQRRKLRS